MPDSVPEQWQDIFAIATYPDKPALEEDAVVEFLARFEHDYVSNRLIEEGPPDTPEGVEVDPLVALPSEVVVEVRQVRDGFVAFTDLWIDYVYEVITETPEQSPTATPTPLPSTTNYESSAYYLTDRFLIRQSPPPETEQPTITGGHVVQCW